MINMQAGISQNPYNAMLLTYKAQHFYGRANEVIGILQVITGTEPGSHAIYGIRTIGKTTLLKFLKDPAGALRQYEAYVQHGYHIGGERRLLFVYIHFHHFEKGHSIFFLMLAHLHEDLQDHEIDIALDIQAYDHTTPRQMLVNALRNALQHLHHLDIRVVFLFDDFDTPVKYVDSDDDGLLRLLSNFASMIIATEDAIVELRPDITDSSPFLGILRPEEIGLISEPSARQLICEPAATTGIQFTTSEQNFLLRIAGRQPFLLTATCELYFNMRRDFPDIYLIFEESGSLDLQTEFIARLLNMPHIEQIMQITWSRLSTDEQRILHNLVHATERGAQAFQSEYVTTIARLINKALVYPDYSSNTHRVFSHLFEEFVRRIPLPHYNRPTSAPLPPRLGTHSDHLTPIDRALLDFFRDRTGQLCTFDEILDAVWDDPNGSKRALEAAVHRLRKNLGQGQQIRSIRGKGYKFVTEKQPARHG